MDLRGNRFLGDIHPERVSRISLIPVDSMRGRKLKIWKGEGREVLRRDASRMSYVYNEGVSEVLDTCCARTIPFSCQYRPNHMCALLFCPRRLLIIVFLQRLSLHPVLSPTPRMLFAGEHRNKWYLYGTLSH